MSIIFDDVVKFQDTLIIFEGKMFYITGRRAIKKSSSGKLKELWEICPYSMFISNKENGTTNINFNKWIQPSNFMIIEDKRNPIDPEDKIK